MGVEIERKFLVANDGWKAGTRSVQRLRQGYLSRGGRASVRVRVVDGREAWITVKSANTGSARMEFEYRVPVEDTEHLLGLCRGQVIDKSRHEVPHAGRIWQVDVFHGINGGLVIAEVELERSDAAIDFPAWVGAEVTGDRRYYNSSLAEQPITGVATGDLRQQPA